MANLPTSGMCEGDMDNGTRDKEIVLLLPERGPCRFLQVVVQPFLCHRKATSISLATLFHRNEK